MPESFVRKFSSLRCSGWCSAEVGVEVSLKDDPETVTSGIQIVRGLGCSSVACVLNGVSRERYRGLVCERSGEEQEEGPEPGGDNLCESRRWSILANFVFYIYFIYNFFLLFLFKVFQLFHRQLNEATKRKTPVYKSI